MDLLNCMPFHLTLSLTSQNSDYKPHKDLLKQLRLRQSSVHSLSTKPALRALGGSILMGQVVS